MTGLWRAGVAGMCGAVATNVAHEVVRRVVPTAPRVDLLGMQALAKTYRALGAAPPVGRALYVQTLAGDLAANSAYFALVGFGPRVALRVGVALGIAAGIGAVVVPERTDLAENTTGRTLGTKLLTIGLYLAGGVVAGAVERTS